MKRQWDIEELIEHFTLIEEDLPVLGIKTGATRFGCALLFKCFQYEGRFPSTRNDIPKAIIDYIAHQLKLDAALFAQYDWEGRTIKGQRTQIREHLSFREATVLDTEEMKQWLIAEKLASDQNMEHLKVVTIKQFRERKIEPQRLIRSACTTYEQTLFAEIMQRLPLSIHIPLDDLLTRSTALAEQEKQFQDDELARTTSRGHRTPLTWQDLKTNPGAVGLDSVLNEIDKVQVLTQLALLRLGTAEIEAILRHFNQTELQHPTYIGPLPNGAGPSRRFSCVSTYNQKHCVGLIPGLNDIETWNEANGFIYFGKSSEFAINRLDEQEPAALSLHLLQICLVYVNSLLIQQVLTNPKHLQQMKKEDLRALTPLIYAHITPYRTFRLDLSERIPIEEKISA